MVEVMKTDDQVRRFVLENHPVRGHWVHLERAWRSLREHKEYPPEVRDLLGEAVCAAVLLAATLKFRGTLTLQLQGNGAVHLLVAQCTHDFQLRAVARYTEERLASGDEPVAQFHQLVGDEGRVIVTIEAAERDMRYQGIVPLSGGSLSECLEAYFASSEQLPTKVRLAADEERAAGLLVQKLPSGDEEEDESPEDRSPWQDAQKAIAETKALELLDSPVEEVLTSHFRDRDVRLFKPQSVQFECRCNPERVTDILRALGADEVRDVLKEQGTVTVTCDYCSRPYRYDAEDIERIFSPGYVPPNPSSLQ
jgi:molecular chaperone Hsp33